MIRAILSQLLLEAKRAVLKAIRGKVEHLTEPEPSMPLSHRDVVCQQEQIRRATTILPPKR